MVKFSTVWPPLLVSTVIVFVYAVYMYHNMLPQFERALGGIPVTGNPDANTYTPTVAEIISLLAVFHVLFFMLLLCFMRSALTPPGNIPNDDEKWKEGKFGIDRESEDKIYQLINDESYGGDRLLAEAGFLKSLPVVERKLKNKGAKYRYCSTCDMYKPDRTHHCRICNTCILRMDHHCPWVANCIGFNNYKYFLLFLFYGFLCAGFILATTMMRLIKAFRPMLDTKTFMTQDLLVIVACALCLFLFIALFVFFCFHISLVMDCVTTIELREKRNSDSAGVQHRWMVANTKFNHGSRYKNLKHVLGSPWMWLFPIPSNQAFTDGTYAEVPLRSPQ